MPTLQDVARHAGVSTATVSRFLNSPDRVTRTTRERVQSAVQELGYAPNFAARVLAARRTQTIGAIIPTMENAIFARGLQALQEELAVHGYTLLVASSSYSTKTEAAQIRTLLARGADALLLIGLARDASVLDMLMARNVPHVVAWSCRPGHPSLTVGFDNRAAMRGLTDLVLDMGHRQVAMISAPTAENDRAADRLTGMRDALTARGLAAKAIPVLETPYGIENGAVAMARHLARDPRPTAVLCGNDVLAAGAMMQARAAGLDVPGDVSVTGFDDIELAALLTPGLTTVHVPHRQMGRRAARLLVAALNDQATGPSLCLTTHIENRGSLAPPRPT